MIRHSNKRIIYLLLVTFLLSYLPGAKASALQDRRGGGKGRTERTQKGGSSGKPVKEVPKSRKQDKPEPVKGKGRR
ncbi:hypothetical protein [Arcticibacter pallidicorallinus]|uniref:hypothetical protein n=1 Tax=Arcticibacter pallidicorallinus TaxID=1259464 RepID=UPI000D07F411|nr:hypothetical protein [Arcticibacter pallidicorallinus]